MTALMLGCLIMVPFMSPLKVAFSVVVGSLLTGLMTYSQSNSLFPASALVISFSSGMMILFCYSALMSNYESKNKMSKTMTLMMVSSMALCSASMSTSTSSNNINMMSSSSSATLLCVAMCVVVLSMICINKCMFSPSKPLVTSY